jgi:predicted nuclease of restriction endonuclease-like (RecB) superfamily
MQVLEHHINANLYKHQGKITNNFTNTLPGNIKANALQVFQDEYLFDFISLEEDDERVIEGQLVSNIKNMIMTLGKGFSFIGNQYRLEIDGEEFFIDLLFFNRHLQCLVAFELKRGKFKPEYAGQLNFYLNVLDDKVRLPHEHPSIGIVLLYRHLHRLPRHQPPLPLLLQKHQQHIKMRRPRLPPIIIRSRQLMPDPGRIPNNPDRLIRQIDRHKIRLPRQQRLLKGSLILDHPIRMPIRQLIKDNIIKIGLRRIDQCFPQRLHSSSHRLFR